MYHGHHRAALGAALLGPALLAASAGALAATALDASMQLTARAQLGELVMTQSDTDAWGGTLSPLSVTAGVIVIDESLGYDDEVQAYGVGRATWASDDSGSVTFDYGLKSYMHDGYWAASLNTAVPDWSYTFVAGSNDGYFHVLYDVTTWDVYNGLEPGMLEGLSGWSIFLSGGPEGTRSLDLWNSTDPTASGYFQATLTAGSTYVATLVNNTSRSNDIGNRIWATMHGQFDWSIQPGEATSVPEPASALLLLGGLATGIATRRRR
jgi:hypothetical protein